MEGVVVEERGLVLRQAQGQAGGFFVAPATVVDDGPLWMGWEMAQRAWLKSKGAKTAATYEVAVRQFFAWAGVAPWQVSRAVAVEWANWMVEEGKAVIDRRTRRPVLDEATGEEVREPLAKSSANVKLAALTNFYKFVQDEYTGRAPDGRDISLWPADRANPFAGVKRHKVSPFGRAKWPSMEEMERILALINTECLTGLRDATLIRFLLVTCLRISAVLEMQWGDFEELSDGDFALRYRYKGEEEKERRLRLDRMQYQAIVAYVESGGRLEGIQVDDFIWVPLEPVRARRMALARLTQELRLARTDLVGVRDPVRVEQLRGDVVRLEGELVAAEERPLEEYGRQPISNGQVNNILKKYARRAGMDDLGKAHVHGLRHAGLKHRYQKMRQRGQVDLLALMQISGHASLDTLRIYIQQVLEEPEDEMAREVTKFWHRERGKGEAAVVVEEQGRLFEEV